MLPSALNTVSAAIKDIEGNLFIRINNPQTYKKQNRSASHHQQLVTFPQKQPKSDSRLFC
jgi:hypothetical protein